MIDLFKQVKRELEKADYRFNGQIAVLFCVASWCSLSVFFGALSLRPFLV